jgi:hypothetical protein
VAIELCSLSDNAVLRQLMKTIASLRRASSTENYRAAVVEVRCVTFAM